MNPHDAIYAVRNISLSESGPDSLFDLCLSTISKNLTIICTQNPLTKDYTIKSDIILPREICEQLLEKYQQDMKITDKFIRIFRDKGTTSLRRVCLRHAAITDYGFSTLLDHHLEELHVVNCDNLTINSLSRINNFSSNLVVLEITGDIPFFNDDTMDQQRTCAMRAPMLKQLILKRQDSIMYPQIFLENLSGLTHLDISECSSPVGWPCILELNHLESLILYNVYALEDAINWICSMKNLRHLDISQSSDRYGKYHNPNKVLSEIIEALPKLISLDISGTNLAGTGVAEPGNSMMKPGCDIPGLVQRVNNPLKFLGLYGTLHAACCRHDIPAQMITGHSNENQILAAAIAYIERPEILTRVLNDLYHLFRYDNEKSTDVAKSLLIVLEAMDRHISEKHIQISGSATLFYIVKGKERNNFGMRLKQRIIRALLNGMEAHMEDDTMMRNGCLTLCQFKIPLDVVFEYERVVVVLLHGVSDSNQEGFVQRIAIYLLNSLACQVDGKQKQFLGDNGAITKMLDLISDRLSRNLCDDVLEVAWSTMWNVTDENPSNCSRFLRDRGMEYFLGCLRNFPEKEELLRNMMGLLGNVAEVPELRPVFMTSMLLTVFTKLLNSHSDGIEVSYNAAGVLAHMMSDGDGAWSVSGPFRDVVLSSMVDAIDRWDINSKRNINYRSFEPILGLLNQYHTPECQYWAVWALANLTSVYPDKYCSLVKAENGLPILNSLTEYHSPYDKIKNLAKRVVENIKTHEKAAAKENTAKAAK